MDTGRHIIEEVIIPKLPDDTLVSWSSGAAHITFTIGVTLSIAWREGNYSSIGRQAGGEPTFETAWWRTGQSGFLNISTGEPASVFAQVQGWQSASDILDAIGRVISADWV